MDRGYQNSLKKILSIAGIRELVFWGTDALSLYVYNDLRDMGRDIKYFVTEAQEKPDICGKPVKSWIDLFYEDKEAVFIVAFVFSGHGSICQKLQSMGFVFEQNFLLYGFGGYIQKFDAVDSMLGYNRFYGETLGFEILGTERDCSYKIMVLGGSTVDPTMGNHIPWASFLYNKLAKIMPDVVVLNGGMAGYSADQEFYKFVRDGLFLAPDMVITYDGINDVGCIATDINYQNLNPYAKKVFDYIERKGDFAPDTLELRHAKKIVHGLSKRSIDDVDRWKHSIRKIHAVASEFNIKHIGFLQPMLMAGHALIEESHRELILKAQDELPIFRCWANKMEKFQKCAVEFCAEKEYMFDLTTCLDGKSGMYYDICHSTDAANQILAEEICRVIIDQEERFRC